MLNFFLYHLLPSGIQTVRPRNVNQHLPVTSVYRRSFSRNTYLSNYFWAFDGVYERPSFIKYDFDCYKLWKWETP